MHPNHYLITAFLISVALGNAALWKTTTEANASLPEGDQFSGWWWTFGEYVRLWKIHKRLHPTSRWRFYWLFCVTGGVILLFLSLYSAR